LLKVINTVFEANEEEEKEPDKPQIKMVPKKKYAEL
jgi:hypothetical protein